MEIATTAKAAAGGGAVAVGGTAIGVGILGSGNYVSVLADAKDFRSTYVGQYGDSGNNKNLFVDPDANQSWWEERYKSLEKATDDNKKLKDATSIEFKAVNNAFSETNEWALNKTCKKALVSSENTIVTRTGYKEDVWKFCAKGGTVSDVSVAKPTQVVIAVGNDSTKFLGREKHKGKFVDADSDSNKTWWNWMYNNVLIHDKNKDDTHPLFKVVDRGYSSSNNNALNKVCKTAYGKRYQEVTNIKYKKNIWKYCSKENSVSDSLDASIAPSATLTYANKSPSSKFEELEENRGKFVSDISNNEEWWNWSYENRYLVDEKSGMSYEFKQVIGGYGNNNNNLNKVCQAVYVKPLTGMEEKYKADAWKYCSRDGSKPKPSQTTRS